MQSPLLAHVNCLGLIPPKHGVIFPQCGSLIFKPKTIWLISRNGWSSIIKSTNLSPVGQSLWGYQMNSQLAILLVQRSLSIYTS
jgi:hypothetical protein